MLARGEKQGVFTRHQVLVNTSLLLLAGHETTINLLCNGTLAFINHPDQWALLQERPDHALRAANEAVRLASPVRSFARHASRSAEIEGVEIPDGARVMMVDFVGKRLPRPASR